MVPGIEPCGLVGGFRFMDAQTDDARLVLRLINESVANGGTALNYTTVTGITRNADNDVCGIRVNDTETGQSAAFSAPTVINATGAWAESLHPVHNSGLHLRPLRGSHLVLPSARLPVSRAVTLIHPDDGRPLFVIPWENALILGTTDVDHGKDANTEVTATHEEARYMIECLNAYFPAARITLEDCIASFAGIRPVLTKKETLDPSKESREHVIWSDRGLVTITGGKLTTFRVLAQGALKAAAPYLPAQSSIHINAPAFSPVTHRTKKTRGLAEETARRLYGRYGNPAAPMIATAATKDLAFIPGTHTLWAELPLLAETEQIRHLTDLLLRRVRIGMLLPQGGAGHLDRIQKLCQPHLPWDNQRWKKERKLYIDYWHHAFKLPEL